MPLPRVTAVVTVFSLHYHCDSEAWEWRDDPARMTALAHQAARWLLAETAPEDHAAVATLLRRLRDDRCHPLHQRIEEMAVMEFTDETLWPRFRHTVDDMLAFIEDKTRP